MYLTTFCFISELVMALVNTWKFLYKEKKYKTWPLLMFYILAILLSVFRMYNSFFLLMIMEDLEIFGSMLPPIVKFDIGIV